MIFDVSFCGEGLKEYPRPQFERDSYMSLNGSWDYAMSNSADAPAAYDGKILVPYSPESPLSGVNRQLKCGEYLHYRTFFRLPQGFDRGRVLLNFGAVDQCCTVLCNGKVAGGHEGGYLPFTIEITDFLRGGENELRVVVTDDASSHIYGRGKQSYEEGGIWYTATSGIWQSVWLESVPKVYVTDLRLYPDAIGGKLTLCARTVGGDGEISFAVYDGDKVVAMADGIKSGERCVLDVSACKRWSPDDPQLYPIKITCGQDVIKSYFGLRTFGIEKRGKWKCFTLNGRPIFHNGLLDQGYWGSGLYTPASCREMYDCLRAVKALGFNMLRKHIKIEHAIWYYYCDVLGILVWQDMINGGAPYKKLRINLCPFVDLHLNDADYKSMGRDDPRSRRQYMAEAEGTIDALFNCVSLCLWTPFNEAWGQFDAVKVCNKLRSMDGTRAFDHASGWQDKGGGDVYSRHIYFRKLRPANDKKRVLAVTEFGGYVCTDGGKKVFGYRKFNSPRKYMQALSSLYLSEVLPLIYAQGLAATVYTQLSDVRQEQNGLFTEDGQCKVSAQQFKDINARIYAAFNAVFGN